MRRDVKTHVIEKVVKRKQYRGAPLPSSSLPMAGVGDPIACGAVPSAVHMSLEESSLRPGRKNGPAQVAMVLCGSTAAQDEQRAMRRGFVAPHKPEEGLHTYPLNAKAFTRMSDALTISRPPVPLEEVVREHPWRPSGSVSYSAEVHFVPSTPKKNAKDEDEKLVARLYEAGMQRQANSQAKLTARYCKPPEKGRALTTKEMTKQYDRSVTWEQAVRKKVETAYNPTPPPAKAKKPMNGPQLKRSVSRLYKGVHGDNEYNVYTAREQLYSKYDVRLPPRTLVHSAKGTYAQTKQLTRRQQLASAARLHDQTLRDQSAAMQALHSKYVPEPAVLVHAPEEWSSLVTYLHAGGDTPAYRKKGRTS